jgi:hypothetical protein
MKRFFLGMILLLLAGCGEREPVVITPPKEATSVIEPFLKQLAAGNKDKAAAYLSPAALDELDSQFAADSKKLASTPKLTPRFMDNSESLKNGPADNLMLVYGSKQNGKWTSATFRLFRVGDDPYKIEYWRVTNTAPQPAIVANIDTKRVEMQQKITFWTMAGLAVLGVLGLVLLYWLIRRKPHLIAPDAPAEARRSAASVRDE